MAEQQQPADGDVGTEGKPSKGGGKTFLVTIVAVILVAVGAGAVAAYMFFPQVTAMVSGTKSTAKAPDRGEPVEYGEFMELPGLMVNPAGTDGRRHLMVSVGLEGPDSKVLEHVELRQILIKDRILSKLSSLSVEQLSNYSTRDSIKTDILTDINRVFEPGSDTLTRLYFTAFILQ